MKKKTQKLSLRKITISALNPSEMNHLGGAKPTTYRHGCPDPETSVNVPCPSQGAYCTRVIC